MLKKIILAILITVFSTSVYASDFKAVVNPSNGSVVGIGKSCQQKKSDVFITVAYPGADIDNLTVDINNVSYIKGLNTDDYGNFSVAYSLGIKKTGIYQINVNDGCGQSGHRKSFEMASVNDADTAISSLNGILSSSDKSVTNYETFIRSNQSVFGIKLDEEYESCDKTAVWNMMKKGVPYSTNTDVFIKFYSALATLNIGTAGEAEIPGIVGEYMLLADSESRELFEKLDSNALKHLYSNVKKAPFNSSTFEKDLRKMLIVETFNNNDRSAVKDNIEKYAAELGIDISTDSDFGKLKNQANVYIGMANNASFNSFDDIKTTFNTLVADCLKKEANTSTLQGGGGSNSDVGVSLAFKSDNNNVPGTATVDFSPFKDLDGALWAKGAIEYLYSKKVISGVSDTEFKPNDNVKREEFVKMLVVAFDIYNTEDTAEFDDVDNGAWYASYVASGVKNGIVAGIGDSKFGVGSYITRQDMAVMLYRIIQKQNIDISEMEMTEFSDTDEFAPYSREAIEKLSAMEIVSGMGDGVFAPKAYLTRAMAAAVIARVINR